MAEYAIGRLRREQSGFKYLLDRHENIMTVHGQRVERNNPIFLMERSTTHPSRDPSAARYADLAKPRGSPPFASQSSLQQYTYQDKLPMGALGAKVSPRLISPHPGEAFTLSSSGTESRYTRPAPIFSVCEQQHVHY